MLLRRRALDFDPSNFMGGSGLCQDLTKLE